MSPGLRPRLAAQRVGKSDGFVGVSYIGRRCKTCCGLSLGTVSWQLERMRETMKLLFGILSCLAVVSSTSGQPLVIPVWPHGVPGSRESPDYRQDTVYTEKGAPRIRHVVNSTLSVYLPPPDGGRGRQSSSVLEEAISVSRSIMKVRMSQRG